MFRSPTLQRYKYIHSIRSQTDAHTLQLSGTSHFSNDLGLDSLDTVEVVMAIEEVSVCHRTGDWYGD